MANRTAPLLPATDALLRALGERLRVARLRRKLSAKHVSERAGMAPMTLRSVERGGSGVTIGAYVAVMQVLGIEQDLALLGQADPLGRQLQDARLPARSDAATQTSTESRSPARPPPRKLQTAPKSTATRAPKPDRDWIEQGGFSSAESLARLLEPGKRRTGRKR